MLRARLSLLALAAAGCAPDLQGDPPHTGAGEVVGQSSRPIIGGAFDPADPAVVSFGGFCTGTLISPRVVLTAAHCVEDFVVSGNTNVTSVGFGNGDDPWIDVIDVIDMAMHRLYDPPSFLQWDVAAIRLAEPAPAEIAPVPFNRAPLDDADLGASVRVIGFGVTDGAAQTGGGTKRQVQLTLDELTYYHIGVGTDGRNSCQGDSGGPTMMRIDGEERVIGVTSFGSNECRDRSYMTRVDSMQDWIVTVMGAWDGPCALDGDCVTDGCATIDPDCDICGFDGVCGTDCPAVDLDCAVGARAGDLCGDEFDCETRLCIAATDDARLSYCSTSCDPERPLDTCPPPLSSCVDGPDGPTCRYSGPTPSAQGAPCEDGGDCRSGVCDPDHAICIEQCGDGYPACKDPYACEDVGGALACTVPSEGGCLAAGRTAPWAAAGCLALLLVMARRRRR